MQTLNYHPTGRHFLQIPGPTPVPDRILKAMSYPTIDHRGPEFGALGLQVLGKIKQVYQTKGPVIIYSASGTGAWEAALTNVCSPGDHVLMYETGQFAWLWQKQAAKLGLNAEIITMPGTDVATGLPTAWRHGVQAQLIQARLQADTTHTIKAVCVVHNETSTGATSDISDVRRAIDAAKHPALLLVDTISGLGSAEYNHEACGADVSISGSQKGLMMPPGIGLHALSPKAIEASKKATLPKSYWDWAEIIEMNKTGYWPSTPNTNLLYGLDEVCDMLLANGLPVVFERHQRWAMGVRTAVKAWGLEILCTQPAVYSPILTGVVMPQGIDADAVRKIIYERFDCSLGAGLGKLKGRMFRIGHLGDTNDLTLLAALAGCEMGMKLAGIKLQASGVQAAMDYYSAHAAPAVLRKAA